MRRRKNNWKKSNGKEGRREGGREGRREGGDAIDIHSFSLKPHTHRVGSNCGSSPPSLPPSFPLSFCF